MDAGGNNIGIGTGSPSTKLHVSTADEMSATFESTDDTSRIRVMDDDTTTYVVAKDNFMSLGTNNTLHANNLNIKNDGKVGIGTTAPGKKLHVEGAIAVSGAESAGDSGYGYSLYQYNQSGAQTLRLYSDSRGVSGGKRQFINVSGRLTMEATENMGIGPSVSGEYLHLYAGATAHMYLDAGDSFLFRDKDDSSATVSYTHLRAHET